MLEVKLNSKRLGVALVIEFKMRNESKRIKCVQRNLNQKLKNEEIVMNKLGLNWAKLSLKLGLKLEFEAEV